MKLSIGRAWDETSAFLGKETRLVVPVALATFALPSVLVNWANAGRSAPGNTGWLMLLVLLAVLLGQMTVILLANGWRGSIGEALGTAARRLPVLVAALLIVFLPVMLISAAALGAALVSAGITDPAAVSPAALMKARGLSWIVFILLLLAIFLAVRMFLGSAIAASEPGGPIALIKRSWTLTKGNFWRLLALFLLLMLIGLILNAAVTTVIGSVATLAAGEPRPFNTSALFVALATGLVGAIVSTVSATMVGRVYAQLTMPSAGVPTS